MYLLVGILLPPFDQTPKSFMAQILCRQKKVLLKKDVPVLSAPKWPELATAEIWAKLQNDALVMSYFPREHKPGQKLPDRNFLWRVLFTLRGDWCEDLILEAHRLRAEKAPSRDPKNTILNVGITREWADVLLEQPFVSRKFPFHRVCCSRGRGCRRLHQRSELRAVFVSHQVAPKHKVRPSQITLTRRTTSNRSVSVV